jgi:hypothetical protein
MSKNETVLEGDSVSNVEPIGDLRIDVVLCAILRCATLGVIDVVLVV